jgi:uncharacterized protein YegP (UPF0339 family)
MWGTTAHPTARSCASGEAYGSKSAAKEGCESVLHAATGASIVEVDK